MGEDFSLSDFHQYPTFLNIPAAYLPAHFRDLVAGGMSPRALFYFKNKGFKEEEAALGLTVMTMVRPAVSGVLFTHAPEQAAAEAALIQAVWGVGRFKSGRLVNADQYLVARQPPGQILSRVIARQEYMLVCRPDAGLEEVPVNPREVEAPCLNSPLLQKLCDWAGAAGGAFRQAPGRLLGSWTMTATSGSCKAAPCRCPTRPGWKPGPGP